MFSLRVSMPRLLSVFTTVLPKRFREATGVVSLEFGATQLISVEYFTY